jgi:hypothetical protein
MKFRIRFNKSRGQPGRGTPEHVWRVFVGKKEYLAKHVVLDIPSRSEKEEGSEDWNIVCEGEMVIDRETSTIKIVASTI